METTITIQNRELSTRVKNKKQIIMKKFYLLAAAATILTACTNNEKMTVDLDNDGPVLIGFETYHEKSTKATATGAINDGTDLIKDHGGFGVWGFKGASATYSSTAKTLEERGFTTVFDNVKVWYEGGNPLTPTQGYTYAVPKYWDKGMKYIFFAYAPFDGTNATIDWEDTENDTKEGIGIIKISDIPSIQNVSKSKDNKAQGDADNKPENIQFEGSNTTGVTDYLMGTCVDNQYLTAENKGPSALGTNQNYGNDDVIRYTDQEQTVGFTFGHMLSKFQVNLKASAAYPGIKSIKVNTLSIENMPSSASTKVVFTQTAPTAPAGTYNTTSYTSTLSIIGAEGTSTNSLFILKNGSLSGETVTKPTEQLQSFNYYVAPNTPSGTGTDKYKLNIAYTIEYVDGITEDVTIADVDLSSSTTPLTTFAQNNSYNLTISVGLNQIFFTVVNVTNWADDITNNIEIK